MRAQTRPDVILVVLDTLRADRLSCYGFERETSPHIDAFAQDAVLFEHAISPAQWTIPAHASLFTGEYPTTHGTTQIYDKHTRDVPMLAELLRAAGYHTVGFCSNVLLGVVDNELDRGFAEFYNYGGTFPNRPSIGASRPRAGGRVGQRLLRSLRPLATRIQDGFAHNNMMLRVAFHPRVIPLWQRFMNTKGNSSQSLRDMVGYLRARRRKGPDCPVFAFINLMETHLPFGPRPHFIRQFVPYYHHDAEARAFMQSYNLEYYRWLVPFVEPLTDLQDRVLKDMHAAEVAFEDHLLRHLFSYLDQPGVRENTLVIITSDHGEGLNHHGCMGHSLFAYDDLLHVPLLVRYPPLYASGLRVATRVSARRVFHTVLEAAGIDDISRLPVGRDPAQPRERAPVDVKGLSLARSVEGADPEGGVVWAEAYPPETLLAMMECNDPEALEAYRCRLIRRAAYEDDCKLVTVDGQPDELFDIARDPAELHNLLLDRPALAARIDTTLSDLRAQAQARQPGGLPTDRLDLDGDAAVEDRLRRLGYLA